MGVEFLYGFLFAIILIIVIGVWLWAMWRIKKAIVPVPSHVELYFDEHFKDIVKEWDLQSRSDVKAWCSEMGKKLDSIGKGLEKIKKFRAGFEPRLEKLESTLGKLEKA
jgi:cbb3-type cytochrome oxidase subunit 3